MTKNDKLFEKAFSTLKQDVKPTRQQRDAMLNHILEYKQENILAFSKLKRMVAVYPWRFAFAVSAVQAAVLTTIFGTRYTNLFLKFFGG